MKVENWERGRAVSFLGIFVSNFRYSAFAVYTGFSILESSRMDAYKGKGKEIEKSNEGESQLR